MDTLATYNWANLLHIIYDERHPPLAEKEQGIYFVRTGRDNNNFWNIKPSYYHGHSFTGVTVKTIEGLTVANIGINHEDAMTMLGVDGLEEFDDTEVKQLLVRMAERFYYTDLDGKSGYTL